MNKLTVQSEDLRQQSANVTKGASEVSSILSQLTGQIQNLASEWEGGASSAFQNRWQEWQHGATTVQQAMDDMGRFLAMAADTYEQTEAGLQQSAGS